ncbi:MAG: GAF domain-containing protein [Acidobacteriota bacterium]
MSEDKVVRYRHVTHQIESLLEGLTDPVAAMASVAALLYDSHPAASWVGFYRVVAPELLRVGPYQGPVGCLEIEFGKGVCGAAARTLKTQIVADVHSFEGHIACDPASRSEIVVPVLGPERDLKAVLDLDSRQVSAFDEIDAMHLERIVDVMTHVFELEHSN